MSLYTRKGLDESPSNLKVTIPYATPQSGTKFGQVPRPPTAGIAAVIPLNMTIVDSRTLGVRITGK